MLPTLVIGLREGLEAALVVGIIAAFLRRHDRSLRAMWVGVALAIAASFAIGGGLLAVESALPQAAQEGMEAVIGLLAVVFVTTMVVWMRSHARSMQRELEAAAQRALGAGTSLALAVMAFLAVLKEGFETSVFLIATFRAAVDPVAAATGAVVGLLAAVAVGIGIARGGIRLDLRRFYRWTSPFLVLLAGGLLLTAVRKAHGAGWIDAGQQPTVDLSWLAPRGSVVGALVTGVLGVPPDPRLIEVVAWCAYVVPVGALVLWPASKRPSERAADRLRWAVVALLGGAAVVLALAVPSAAVDRSPLRLAGGGTATTTRGTLVVSTGGSAQRVPLTGPGTPGVTGAVATSSWSVSTRRSVASPASITLADLVTASGGRVPVGIDAAKNPGPFTAAWTVVERTAATTADGVLVDTRRRATVLLTVSGGGLTSRRSVTVAPATLPGVSSWSVPAGVRSARLAGIQEGLALEPEHRLWGVEVPILLVLVAAATGLVPLVRSRLRRTERLSSPAALRPDGP